MRLARLALWLGLLCGSAWAEQGGLAVRPPDAPPDAKPELVTQFGHASTITALAFSPDGRRLATGSYDGLVLLWDLSARCLWRTIRPDAEDLDRGTYTTYGNHVGCVTALAFSPDGRLLAIGGRALSLWSVETGEPVAPAAKGRYQILAAAFTRDGTAVLAGGGAGDVLVSGAQSMGELSLYGLDGAVRWQLRKSLHTVTCLALSPDGRTLVTGHWDGLLRRWNPADGSELGAPLVRHHGRVGAVTWSPDGRWLVSAGWLANEARMGGRNAPTHADLTVWDMAAATPAPQWAGRNGNSVVAAAFSPDGATLATFEDYATGQACREFWLYDFRAGSLRPRSERPERLPMPHQLLGWSPDGRWLVMTDDDSRGLQFREARTGRPVAPWIRGTISPARYPRLSPDAHWVVALNDQHTKLLQWDLTTGRPCGPAIAERELRAPDAAPGEHRPIDCDHFWGVDGKLTRLVMPPGRGLRTNQVRTADGRLMAGVTSGTDFVFLLYDLASGRSVGPPTYVGYDRPGEVGAAVLGPDGHLLAYAHSELNVVRLADLATGGAPRELPEARAIHALAFSPDGRTLVGGGEGGELRRWDVATGRLLGEPLHGAKALYVRELAFSPSGRFLAVTNWPSGVTLWDLGGAAGPSPVAMVRGELAAAFTPDGQRLLTNGRDGSLKLWDGRTLRPLASIYTLNQGADYVTVTPQGYYDCSLEAPAAVVWRIGGFVYPFDQFADKYLRPDLVRRALAGEDLSGAPALDATQLPPNLAITSPAYGAELAGDTVAVELQAAGQRPIRRIDLTVNGAPLSGEAAQALQTTGEQPTRTFKLSVPLPPGEPRVRLRAVAYDTDSLRSRVEEVTVFRPGVKQQPGVLHVLAVGINHYPALPAAYQLRFAVPDARAVAEALGRLGGGSLYAAVKPQVLTDDQATVTNLKFALRELKDSATENDVAVVFVSGHGVADAQGNYYFPTCQVDLNDLSHTALTWQDFVAALRDVRAKRVLVLADTCHSGGVAGAGQSTDELLARKLNREAHRLVFAASGRDEVSLAKDEWGHGAFTEALLEAWRGQSDVDQDGRVTFQELKDFVPERVAALTDGRQHPQLPFLDSFEPDAAFALVAGPSTPPAAPPRPGPSPQVGPAPAAGRPR